MLPTLRLLIHIYSPGEYLVLPQFLIFILFLLLIYLLLRIFSLKQSSRKKIPEKVFCLHLILVFYLIRA